MPLAKVHVLEGQYDKARLAKMSEAIQNALVEVLGVPDDDFFQIHHVLPRDR
jgi:4-oxalocrotonate tautomerase